MKAILSVTIPYITGLVALFSFSHGLTTALVFVCGMTLIAIAAVRFHSKHNRTEVFDDRLTDERMAQAVEYLIRKGGDKKRVED